MKKNIVLVLTFFILFGCSEDLEFNTPSFQAKKDRNLWEAVTFRASVDASGTLTIVGFNNLETITLVVNNTEIGFHDMLETNSSGALLDINDVQFSTNNLPDPSVQLYPADGTIELKEINAEAGYVSGAFRFIAFSGSGLSTVNLSDGVFYRVPLLSAPLAKTHLTHLVYNVQ